LPAWRHDMHACCQHACWHQPIKPSFAHPFLGCCMRRASPIIPAWRRALPSTRAGDHSKLRLGARRRHGRDRTVTQDHRQLHTRTYARDDTAAIERLQNAAKEHGRDRMLTTDGYERFHTRTYARGSRYERQPHTHTPMHSDRIGADDIDMQERNICTLHTHIICADGGGVEGANVIY
jgi:hypothetical protein